MTTTNHPTHDGRPVQANAHAARFCAPDETPEAGDVTDMGPARVLEVEGCHLRIVQNGPGLTNHCTHLAETGDLIVALARGQEGQRNQAFPVDNVQNDGTGVVLVLLGVDGEHDEVHFERRPGIGSGEVLAQASEALSVCREALDRLR